MPAASSLADPQPSSSNTQTNLPVTPTVTVENEEDNNNQEPSTHEEEDDGDQDNNTQPPPLQDLSMEESTSLDTQLPPEDTRILMKILGKAIHEVIEDHDINIDQAKKNQLEVFRAFKDADEPISTFYQQLVSEEAKKTGRLAAITPGYWRLWQRDKQISQIPIKEAIASYRKLPEKQRQEYPNTEAFFPLCLDAYTRQGSSGLKADF